MEKWACIFPVATYGCEGWTINKADENRINAFECKCYRRMLRIPWTAKVRNETILQRLNIQKNWLFNTIKRRKLQYFGHIKRHEGLEKHILEANINGKRGRGRPTRQWTDDIRDWVAMPVVAVGRVASNRDNYRRLIWDATTCRGHAGRWCICNTVKSG